MTATLVGGRYRLEEQIGRGGMASVWRALDTTLGRPVAVKRLHAPLLDDPEVHERFRREAQLVARLDHPNLVRLLDGGEEPEGPFMVFELIEGENLRTLVRERGRLEPDRAARLIAQVARALAYAHERGVVHRDITARNVLVTRDGEAKLTDFGVARLMATEGASGLTDTGMMIGTGDYLAPEQAQGRPVDARSDVYSLGIVLYECLTGRVPFRGEGFLAVAMKHVQEPMPDPRALVPEIPAPLAATVLRATRKEPDERFQRAADLALALEGAEAEEGGHTAIMPVPVLLPPAHDDEPTTGRVRRRRRWPAVAGVLVVVAAGAAGAIWWASGRGGSTTSGLAPREATVALPMQAVRDDDPTADGGDGSENPNAVQMAYDGVPSTAWTTETYFTPEFGGYKRGVGLVIRLKRPARATELDVASPTKGATFEVLGPAEGSAPRPVYGRGTFTGSPQRVRLDVPSPTDVYVLWITRLVPKPDDSSRYWAAVGEVSLRGPANP
jgi:eukaryotic-like serine/threonine-protein kinase